MPTPHDHVHSDAKRQHVCMVHCKKGNSKNSNGNIIIRN